MHRYKRYYQRDAIMPKIEDFFVDLSKRSIKVVLLHNTSVYGPIPLAHSTIIQEKYENIKILLWKINYNTHQWPICVGLEVLTILLAQQSEFTNYVTCVRGTVEIVELITRETNGEKEHG